MIGKPVCFPFQNGNDVCNANTSGTSTPRGIKKDYHDGRAPELQTAVLSFGTIRIIPLNRPETIPASPPDDNHYLMQHDIPEKLSGYRILHIPVEPLPGGKKSSLPFVFCSISFQIFQFYQVTVPQFDDFADFIF